MYACRAFYDTTNTNQVHSMIDITSCQSNQEYTYFHFLINAYFLTEESFLKALKIHIGYLVTIMFNRNSVLVYYTLFHLLKRSLKSLDLYYVTFLINRCYF